MAQDLAFSAPLSTTVQLPSFLGKSTIIHNFREPWPATLALFHCQGVKRFFFVPSHSLLLNSPHDLWNPGGSRPALAGGGGLGCLGTSQGAQRVPGIGTVWSNGNLGTWVLDSGYGEPCIGLFKKVKEGIFPWKWLAVECRMVPRWALKRTSLNSNQCCVTLGNYSPLSVPAFPIYKQGYKYYLPKVIVKIKGHKLSTVLGT